MPRDRYKLSIAVFIVLLREGTVFMIRRKATGWMDGMFSIAAGGLEAGETIRDAARREAGEELGISIDSRDLVHSHTLHSRTSTGDWVGHFFTALTWDGEPHAAEPEKHDCCGWHGLDDLPLSTIPYVRQALRNISLGLSYSEYGWPDC
jgi:8-oxo-dGTP diphosphatase